MRKAIIIGAAITFVLAGSGLVTAAAVIDFESPADLEPVDDQFVALGVDFNASAMVLVAGASLNEFDFPPQSGSKVISNDSVIGASTIGWLRRRGSVS